MIPDFSKQTVETLAKRAAFLCSNPDCRVYTVGPNSDAVKSTTIGEAAHILGARPGALRYQAEMDDASRASITNGIWLCRNCHKKIDADGTRFTSHVLFAWREQHEEFISSELGNSTDRMRFDEKKALLSEFDGYPPLIRRIVLDLPDGWEWRLTAEILRHLNNPLFRRMRDLRDGLYVKPLDHFSLEEMPDWVGNRLAEMSTLFEPLAGLSNKLNESMGLPGHEGDSREIHHVCRLIRDNLEQIVLFEERLRFAHTPEEYGRVVGLLKGVTSAQAEKLAEIPSSLDEAVSLLDDDCDQERRIEKTIVFELPSRWEKEIVREMKRAIRGNSQSGCLIAATIVAIPLLL